MKAVPLQTPVGARDEAGVLSGEEGEGFELFLEDVRKGLRDLLLVGKVCPVVLRPVLPGSRFDRYRDRTLPRLILGDHPVDIVAEEGKAQEGPVEIARRDVVIILRDPVAVVVKNRVVLIGPPSRVPGEGQGHPRNQLAVRVRRQVVLLTVVVIDLQEG